MSDLPDESGFTLKGYTVLWSDVRAIATYKADLLTYDDIRLAFEIDSDRSLAISEEDPAFQKFVTAIEQRFPGIPADWFENVMKPAFKENYRVLWRKA